MLLLSIGGLDEKCGVRRNPFNSLPSRALIATLGVDLGERTTWATPAKGTESSKQAELKVRIQSPPAESRQRTVLPPQAIGCTAPPAVVRRKISPRAHGRRVMMPATRSS